MILASIDDPCLNQLHLWFENGDLILSFLVYFIS